MPKSYGQKLKLICLAKIFYERTDEEHPLSIKEITDILIKDYDIKAERKSLYDDIEALRSLDLDICTARDKSTRYFLATREFELPELELLIDAVQASRFITYEKSISLIKKLETLSSMHQAKKLYRGVYINDKFKSKNKTTYFAIDAIHESISQGTKLSFYYFRYNEKKEKVYRHDKKLYTVSPIALVWDDEKYYLIAYDSKEEKIKHYRVDKMDSAVSIDEPAEGREFIKNSDIGIYTGCHFGMFGGEKEKVTLCCDNSLADIILDRFGSESMLFRNGDTFNVNVDVMVSPPFISWLFSFGNKIKVIHPKHVADKVKATAEEVSKLYK
ncbi:MAG: WYL domain-containing protein [Ruminococcaceae bacterium]|nr:WYL domain-containing protein [Oscillospiraceae bacterium]